MSYQIMRSFRWDAAHRILNHESKCRHLHGHSYTAEIVVEPTYGLDPLGRIIDFSVVKDVVGGWIDAHLDHNILLHCDDPLMELWATLADKNPSECVRMFGGKTPFSMGVMNPTAENIARVVYYNVVEQLKYHPIRVIHVRVWETPSCYADFRPEEVETR